jgi:hypothetical protein
MPKMNDMEKAYHKTLLRDHDPDSFKVQKTVDLAPEVRVNWNMDFVFKNLLIDVKGQIREATRIKAELWALFGDRPLKIVRVLPKTGRAIPLKTITPDPIKILQMVLRVTRNVIKITPPKDEVVPEIKLSLVREIIRELKYLESQFT